ncbi:MAG: hypothetical protein JW982_16270 [Spirochaetes bacterium]|nr:hypothetical protein [Spirochaetota bacterium]
MAFLGVTGEAVFFEMIEILFMNLKKINDSREAARPRRELEKIYDSREAAKTRKEIEEIASIVVDSAFQFHKDFGPEILCSHWE